MKNAIIILIHKQPKQVNLFLEQLLKDTDMDIFIHINKLYDSIRSELIEDERIHVSTNNVKITWGDDNILRAILLMAKEVLDTHVDYSYILVNTGQDLLLRKGIDEFLSKQTKIFIDGHEEDKRRRAYVMYKWPNCYRRLIDNKLNLYKIARRFRIEFFTLFPILEKKTSFDTSGLKFYYNEFWCALPKEVVEFVIDYCTKNPDFLEIYYDGLVPEESFLLTLLMTSKYKKIIEFDEKGYSKNLTYLKGSNNGHTHVNNVNDIGALDGSGMYFFRKFDINVSKEVVMHYYYKIMD